MARHDWFEGQIVIGKESNLLIHNNACEVLCILLGAKILFGKWCFQQKNDWFGHI